MSIRELRESHEELASITMRYEEGGAVQVYMLGDKEIKFDHTATIEQVAAAFKDVK